MKIGRSIVSHERARAILRTLKSQGPLASSTIQKIIDPPIKMRRLHDSLARLIRKNLVVRRHEGFGGRQAYYQLQPITEFHENMAKYLGCPARELNQSYFRYRELYHNNTCALVANQFAKLFPDAKVLRDFEFSYSDTARNLLLLSDTIDDLRPDILLIFPSNGNGHTTSIAVEIERTRKSNSRLSTKLRKFGQETHIDGVIYICETLRLLEIIRRNYFDRVLGKISRVKHYRDRFVTFSNAFSTQLSTNSKLITPQKTSCSLNEWITFIRSTKDEVRRT